MASFFERKKRDISLESSEFRAGDWMGFLDEGVSLEGTLKVKGTLRLDGTFKGVLTCDGLLLVGANGDIEGEIQAKQLSVAGKVRGNMQVLDRMEILERAVVSGELYTPCLVIRPGGYFDGRCHMPAPQPVKEPTTDVVDSRIS